MRSGSAAKKMSLPLAWSNTVKSWRMRDRGDFLVFAAGAQHAAKIQYGRYEKLMSAIRFELDLGAVKPHSCSATMHSSVLPCAEVCGQY